MEKKVNSTKEEKPKPREIKAERKEEAEKTINEGNDITIQCLKYNTTEEGTQVEAYAKADSLTVDINKSDINSETQNNNNIPNEDTSEFTDKEGDKKEEDNEEEEGNILEKNNKDESEYKEEAESSVGEEDQEDDNENSDPKGKKRNSIRDIFKKCLNESTEKYKYEVNCSEWADKLENQIFIAAKLKANEKYWKLAEL